MSAATLLMSGIEIESKQSSNILGFEVTKPLDVELPRSLIPVVISWNIPIHHWVKTCKFILRNIDVDIFDDFLSLYYYCY